MHSTTAELIHKVRRQLLTERGPVHWTGQLSTSALSTATAVMALRTAIRNATAGSQRAEEMPGGLATDDSHRRMLVARGCHWLVEHVNEDGGWGDTTLSYSNVATTMLCFATLRTCATEGLAHIPPEILQRAEQCIDEFGGLQAVVRRYGKDHTFSVPILTHCAIGGMADWEEVMALPFELACVPARWYAAVRMPVVSYALPALIAIGQCLFHHAPPRNPLTRFIRRRAIGPTLRVLERIQPENGGFLEATPLTSFVTMSLLSCGQADSPVVHRGLDFIEQSVRPDGSWPIDTNLATWVTTLSINALDHGPDGLALLSADEIRATVHWLLEQQYGEVHPYTNAAPGGWSWTALPGAVPDADDTPGALIALTKLASRQDAVDSELRSRIGEACIAGIRWLLDLQNRDGGWPTFCRGWGTLPFDRSSNDLTAHVLRAMRSVRAAFPESAAHSKSDIGARIDGAAVRGLRYLKRTQREDGSWLPLWFGNQDHPAEENPLYGTAKVVAALAELTDSSDLNLPADEVSALRNRGSEWLLKVGNSNGSWGGDQNIAGSVEETGLALEALCQCPPTETIRKAAESGAAWLCRKVDDGSVSSPSPIGFYFAKLWYFEQLYPLIFATAGLSAFCAVFSRRGNEP